MSKWMKHPNLPESQLIEVDESTVSGHQRMGWQITDPPPPPPNAGDLEAAAEAAAKKTDTDAPAVDERPKKSNTAKDGKE